MKYNKQIQYEVWGIDPNKPTNGLVLILLYEGERKWQLAQKSLKYLAKRGFKNLQIKEVIKNGENCLQLRFLQEGTKERQECI